MRFRAIRSYDQKPIETTSIYITEAGHVFMALHKDNPFMADFHKVEPGSAEWYDSKRKEWTKVETWGKVG